MLGRSLDVQLYTERWAPTQAQVCGLPPCMLAEMIISIIIIIIIMAQYLATARVPCCRAIKAEFGVRALCVLIGPADRAAHRTRHGTPAHRLRGLGPPPPADHPSRPQEPEPAAARAVRLVIAPLPPRPTPF
jgi:hypothetical protein